MMDREGGDDNNSELDRTSGDERLELVRTSVDKETLVQEGTNGREGLWVDRMGSITSISQSISHSSSSNTTNIPTVTDVVAGSQIWSAGTSLRLCIRDGLGISDVGIGIMSLVCNCWVSWSVVGSGS